MQCLQRLELCSTVSGLLTRIPGHLKGSDQEAETFEGEAVVWAAGCLSLGSGMHKLKGLREDLDRTPKEVLEEARDAVGRECGFEADDMPDMDELNWDWALRRLSRRAWLVISQPVGYLRTQVWREVVRVYYGASPVDEQHRLNASASLTAEDLSGTLHSASNRAVGGDAEPAAAAAAAAAAPPEPQQQFVSEASLAALLETPEEEVREAAWDLPEQQLLRESERLLNYARQTIQMGQKLRKMISTWHQFDAYRILGVARGASRAEVRKAFYKRALTLHPDKGGDKEAFQELQRAYDEILAELDRCPPAEDDDGDGSMPTSPGRSSAADTGPDGDDEGAEEPTREGSEEKETKKAEEAKKAEPAQAAAGEEFEDDEQFGWLTRAVSDAAEGAGECAIDVVRECLSARELMTQQQQQQPQPGVDVSPLLERAELAIDAATAVTEATRLVAELMRNISADSTLKELDIGSEATETAILATKDASVAVSMATEVCLQAIREAGSLMQAASSETAPDDAEARMGAASQVLASLSSLAEASRHLAVAALDAADVAAEAAAAVAAEDAAKEKEGHSEKPGADGEDATSAGQCEEEKPEPEEEEEEEDVADVIERCRSFEGKQAVGAMLESLKMVKCTNQELFRLQRELRALVAKDARAAAPRTSPAVVAERRSRAFALLAEFLDEAALSFERMFRKGLFKAEEDFLGACDLLSTDIAKTSFGWILFVAPGELAVPMDPRSQTLRAAAALDAQAARQMFEVQVKNRLRGAVMNVLLDVACAFPGNPPRSTNDLRQMSHTVADACCEQLLDAFDQLHSQLAHDAEDQKER